MSTATLEWAPPEGMAKPVVAAWRKFYAAALTNYGVTPADYRLMYVAQKGRCWICRKAKGIHPDDPKGRGGRRLGIDHNHLTTAVRGLLCSGGDKTCNRVIGWLDRAALQRAVEYLQLPPARVLAEIREMEDNARMAGVELTARDRDELATAFLWMGEEE